MLQLIQKIIIKRLNIINKTAKKNIKTKNSDININRSYRLNNSSESNLRNQRNNGVICNCIKLINNSNNQNRTNNNIKYITITEDKNAYFTKKIIKYNKSNEECKVNESISPQNECQRISLIKQRKKK